MIGDGEKSAPENRPSNSAGDAPRSCVRPLTFGLHRWMVVLKGTERPRLSQRLGPGGGWIHDALWHNVRHCRGVE